jgi:mono/diheme cytochrome c family protein
VLKRCGVLAAVVLSAALLIRAGQSEVAAPLGPGKALYDMHCATCHGESGRGDGPSAASFASKPSNLTEGRRLNQLPDEFFVSIVLNGGPAEGLSPGMPPFRGNLNEGQIRQVTAYVRTLARPPFKAGDARPIVAVPEAPAQPIFFSHLIHAGSYRIECQYCHSGARRSPAAGVPSVEKCMGCHKIIGAQDNPEIGKIHRYWERREPIPWVRIFKVPEFTYFPHKSHVRAGVACQTCHGPIEQMRVVGADTGPSLANDLQNLIGLRPAARPLSMGWCVDCHRAQNAAQGTRAPLDCVSCHH